VICARIMLRLGDISEWEAMAKAPCQNEPALGLPAMSFDGSDKRR
jgi:hypothetical protein